MKFPHAALCQAGGPGFFLGEVFAAGSPGFISIEQEDRFHGRAEREDKPDAVGDFRNLVIELVGKVGGDQIPVTPAFQQERTTGAEPSAEQRIFLCLVIQHFEAAQPDDVIRIQMPLEPAHEMRQRRVRVARGRGRDPTDRRPVPSCAAGGDLRNYCSGAMLATVAGRPCIWRRSSSSACVTCMP